MAHSMSLHTDFAPPERASLDVIREQYAIFADIPLMAEVLNALPNIFLVLNQQRQVVYANQRLLDLLGLPNQEAARGMRPGELLDCVHAFETDSGCGTTIFCRTCGAVRAILKSLEGHKALEECRVTQRSGQALDLRISTTPLYVEGEIFSLFIVEDISHEKRRQVLERLFYHDILNLSGIISGYAASLDQTSDQARVDRYKAILHRASFRLADVVKHQREIAEAESGELVLHPQEIHALNVLEGLTQFYQGYDIAQDRTMVIASHAQDVIFTTDPLLLERVIGNMVKNALEACQPGDTVTLRCYPGDQCAIFEVHNPTWMPTDVQLQLFQRSFSTKGAGRGLGTYSIKLFTERYLKGSVNFATSPEDGTTFRACYPLELPCTPQQIIGTKKP